MEEARQPEAVLARIATALSANDLAAARAAFAEATAFFRSNGPPETVVHSLTKQAQFERNCGNYEAAERYQLEALAGQRELGAGDRLAHILRHLGDILQDSGRHDDAAPFYDEMIAIYRLLPDTKPLDFANALRSVALHAELTGDRKAARRLWSEACDHYAVLDRLFFDLTGETKNPWVEEALRHLARLAE
jgi:tetratricopeptide (TPR) repeat protein